MKLSLKISPGWRLISKLRQAILSAKDMVPFGPEFTDATAIAAVELLENAVKHAEGSTNSDSIEVSLETIEGEMVVTVSSNSSSEEDLEHLKNTIDKITKGDAFGLYVARMKQIQDKPDGYSRLGLYRIAYETGFSLTYKVGKNQLTVIAKRKLPQGLEANAS